ncbi:hypothetical protein ACIQOW_03805 [Kitasatospora sp. NPDC091335]|uniref:hypothetical protein n=1 Tax=Kitasatospora sp. NPDC091335 TaxID=3364085 RepID=UPI00382DCCF5
MYEHDGTDKPRFNPQSDAWQDAVAGVRDMLDRSQRKWDAEHGLGEQDPAT